MTSRPLSIRTRLTLWYSAVLLAILVVVSALSYSLLRWALLRDLDASLQTVADVIRDTGYSTIGSGSHVGAEAALREVLGPELYDKFFQLVDPGGRAGARSAHLEGHELPLSAAAREHARHGSPTFETVRLATGERARLLTMPIHEDKQLVQLVQVGIPLARAEQTLARYLETLLVLVPLGVVLAGVGGAIVARSALGPVDAMSRTARRITAEDLSERVLTRGTGDELDRLAETLNEMLARLDGAFAEMRRFTADAAHELRTPLTVLKGQIEVTLRAERPAHEYQRILASSLEEVERLSRLAEDLLLLSRVTAGPTVRREPVDLEALVVEALDVGARLGAGRGVSVRLASVVPARVAGDPAALRRALLNLVENAVKYTPAGGKVELGVDVDDHTRGADAPLGLPRHHAAIHVRDSGLGIAPTDAERIFLPFVRLDAARARDTGGAGLGLTIARSIADAHGGTLTVDSVLGGGSTFTLRLPERSSSI